MDLGGDQSFVNVIGDTVNTSHVLWILGHLRPTEFSDGSGRSLSWRDGDFVTQNDLLGYIENDSENGDGAEHLHIGLRLQSHAEAVAADPSAWFRGYEGSSAMGRFYANPIASLGIRDGVPAAPGGLSVDTSHGQRAL